MWEGEHVRSPRIYPARNDLPYTFQIEFVLTHLQNTNDIFASAVRREIEFMKNGQINDEPGIRLGMTNDLGVVAYPFGCLPEQLANYTELEDFKILRSLDIWNVLPETDKAAWFIHEAIYRIYRKLGDTNSDNARKAVALLFSKVGSLNKEEQEFIFREKFGDVYEFRREASSWETLGNVEIDAMKQLPGKWLRVMEMYSDGDAYSWYGLHYVRSLSIIGYVRNVVSFDSNLAGENRYDTEGKTTSQRGIIGHIDGASVLISEPTKDVSLACKFATSDTLVCKVFRIIDSANDPILRAHTFVFRKLPNY